jgi:L-fuconolactonase
MTQFGRRSFLHGSVCFALLQQAEQLLPASTPAFPAVNAGKVGPVIDTHIHLYDPTRPGGVPWPEPSDSVLYRPALPDRYRSLAEPFGIVGAIAIECSPLPADNDWLLHTAASSDLIIGVIGDLDPALPTFPAELERLSANPLFRGIRYGNLWSRSLGAHLGQAVFISNLKLLAHSGLLLESANPNTTLIAELLQLATLVPELRIVIDHLPQAPPPEDASLRDQYLKDLKALSRRSNLFVKGSEILRINGGKVSMNIEAYRRWLDQIWEIFGEDHMLFGSDWPNSDHLASFADTFKIARQYIEIRKKSDAADYFWKNSVAAYGWKPRNAAQANLLRSL